MIARLDEDPHKIYETTCHIQSFVPTCEMLKENPNKWYWNVQKDFPIFFMILNAILVTKLHMVTGNPNCFHPFYDLLYRFLITEDHFLLNGYRNLCRYLGVTEVEGEEFQVVAKTETDVMYLGYDSTIG